MVLFSSTVSLLIFCLLDPSIADRRILIFPAIQWICLFSPVFLSVFPLIFWHSVAKYIHIKYCEFFESWPLSHYHYEDSLSLIIFLVVKSALSQIIIPIPAFFWYIFLLCITFNLSLSLNLKLVSYRKQIVASLKKSSLCFFIFMYLFLFSILHYFMDL